MGAIGTTRSAVFYYSHLQKSIKTYTIMGSTFLYYQAILAKQLQDVCGEPLVNKGHVYYTKLVTNGKKLHYAIFLFAILNILYEIIQRIYFIKPNSPVIVLHELVFAVTAFNIKHGLILLSLLTVSRGTIHIIKTLVRIPRPYETYPTLVKSDKKKMNTFSFPSQSMQSIAIVYGAIFYQWHMFHIYYLLLAIIGMSRIYRGLHYPYDVLISFFLGDYLQRYFIAKSFENDMIFLCICTFAGCLKLYYYYFGYIKEQLKNDRKK